MFKSISFGIVLMLVSGCALSSVNLPDEYIECEHTNSGEVFRYLEENSSKYETNICPRAIRRPSTNQCPVVYMFTDLGGNVRFYSEEERQNWICEVKTSQEVRSTSPLVPCSSTDKE